MTFMDEVHSSGEKEAYKATKYLQIWLSTIAPIGVKLSMEIKDNLLKLCKDMEWETIKDEQIGEILK